MILATLDVPFKRGKCFKLQLVLRCDHCNKVFLCKKLIKGKLRNKFHFCSRNCLLTSMSRGGLFRKQIGDSSEEKYGSRTPFQSSKILNQIKQTLERKYGVSNAYQIKEIKQKAINSLLNNWGAPTFMQSARFKQLIKTHAIQIKRHETMKRNASYGKSRLEDQFYELLCCSFGECNVVRQVAVNHRAIDFYVKSNDCYIQFDGKYWHGLSECYRADKDEPKTHREQYMKYIYEIDRCQDEWFKANNMCLIRVTDVEFKTMGTNVLTKIGLQK